MRNLLLLSFVGLLAFQCSSVADPKADVAKGQSEFYKKEMAKFQALLVADPSLGAFMHREHECVLKKSLSCLCDNNQHCMEMERRDWGGRMQEGGLTSESEDVYLRKLVQEDLYWKNAAACFPADPKTISELVVDESGRGERGTSISLAPSSMGIGCGIIKFKGEWVQAQSTFPSPPKIKSPRETLAAFRKQLSTDATFRAYFDKMHACVKKRDLDCLFTPKEKEERVLNWNIDVPEVGLSISDHLIRPDLFWKVVGECFPSDPLKLRRVETPSQGVYSIYPHSIDGYCDLDKAGKNWIILNIYPISGD